MKIILPDGSVEEAKDELRAIRHTASHRLLVPSMPFAFLLTLIITFKPFLSRYNQSSYSLSAVFLIRYTLIYHFSTFREQQP